MQIDQVPAAVRWKFVRGDSVEFPFRIGTQYPDGSFEPFDLSDWTIQGEVRASEDSDTVLADIIGAPDPTQENETKGVYTLSLDDTDLPRKCVGDVEFITPTGDVHTYQRFEFEVTPDTARIEP